MYSIKILHVLKYIVIYCLLFSYLFPWSFIQLGIRGKYFIKLLTEGQHIFKLNLLMSGGNKKVTHI